MYAGFSSGSVYLWSTLKMVAWLDRMLDYAHPNADLHQQFLPDLSADTHAISQCKNWYLELPQDTD